MKRRRPKLLTLLDGPLAGQRLSPDRVPLGSQVFVAPGAGTEPGMIARHEYRLVGPLEAVWVRQLESVPMPPLHGTPKFPHGRP